jgi:hypothetical protein
VVVVGPVVVVPAVVAVVAAVPGLAVEAPVRATAGA